MSVDVKSLEDRAVRVLSDVASGKFEQDAIGNLIRDLVHAIRNDRTESFDEKRVLH